MTHKELAKEFHILNGGHWHEFMGWKSFDNGISFEQKCSCGRHTPHDICMQHHINDNPTYSTAESVLEVMMKRDDFNKFAEIYFWGNSILIQGTGNCKTYWAVPVNYITEKDIFLITAVNWCREHREVKE